MATINRVVSNGQSVCKPFINEGVVEWADLDLSVQYRGLVRITPADAKWISENINIGNRRPRKAWIAYMSEVIRSGQWIEMHPDPIIFSDALRMIDGQHRIGGIIQSGRTVIAHVWVGQPDGLVAHIDNGLPRPREDRQRFVPDDYEANRRVANLIGAHCYLHRAKDRKPTPEEEREIFAEHQMGFMFSQKFLAAKVKGVCRATVGLALVEMHERDSRKAKDFAASLVHTNGEVSQARILRDWLLRNMNLHGGGNDSSRYRKSVGCMVAYIQDREIQRVAESAWPS